MRRPGGFVLHAALPGIQEEEIASGSDHTGEADEASCPDEDGETEVEAGYSMTRVCDRLLEVFWIEKPATEDWRKLLAFSEEWAKIRPHFFKRARQRAEMMEDPGRKADLFKLARKLKEVDASMERANALVKELEAYPDDLDPFVARRRAELSGDFFDHVRLLAEAAYRDTERREELLQMAARVLTAVSKHDELVADAVSLDSAQEKLDDILNSPSLGEACGKIDQLAARQQLDSTLMLLITKAWAAAKESTMMKEEVKDVMYHLYMNARGNMQRLVPVEVRIMRHLLTIEDPREQRAEMANAFSPGDEVEGQSEDSLYTTPQALHKWVCTVLDAYFANKEGTLIKEAQKLMNPAIIERLRFLKEALEADFL